MFALESLAEGYSHLDPPETQKACDALRDCIRLLIAEEMAGRRDEDKMTAIKDRLDKVYDEHIHAYTHTNKHTRVHAYMHIRVHAHTQRHTHTHPLMH